MASGVLVFGTQPMSLLLRRPRIALCSPLLTLRPLGSTLRFLLRAARHSSSATRHLWSLAHRPQLELRQSHPTGLALRPALQRFLARRRTQSKSWFHLLAHRLPPPGCLQVPPTMYRLSPRTEVLLARSSMARNLQATPPFPHTDMFSQLRLLPYSLQVRAAPVRLR